MDVENPGGPIASQRAYTPSQANLQEKKLEFWQALTLEEFKNWSFLFLDRVTAFFQPAERLSSLVPAASTGPLASPETPHRTSGEKESGAIVSGTLRARPDACFETEKRGRESFPPLAILKDSRPPTPFFIDGVKPSRLCKMDYIARRT
jgi:hypothetical protein